MPMNRMKQSVNRMNNIADLIGNAKNVAITGHIRPDGDCVGSCMGLYNYLKENFRNIAPDVYLEKPGNEFDFIANTDNIRYEAEAKIYDLFIVLDCSDLDRIEPFKSMYDSARSTLCIDHHISNTRYADVNVVDGDASSTCEVLYRLLDKNLVSKTVA